MKRFFAFALCVLLCAALLCGCDSQKGGDVSVDINADIHTLDEFKNGDISCEVTVDKVNSTTATGAESAAEEESETYVFSGQQAVDLYNLLNRSNWVEATQAERPTGVCVQMVTLDFYSGHDLENARQYFGSFTVSDQNSVIASASPMELSLAVAQAPEGTYEALISYVAEKGEADK